MIELYIGIIQASAFCKSPIGNTFIINNADEKAIEELIKELPKTVNIEKDNEKCILKYLGETVIFRY